MSTQLNVTTEEVEKIFTLWYRDFVIDPEQFNYDGVITPEVYGELSTGKFIEYLSKIKGETNE